jgi:hypothetical protein
MVKLFFFSSPIFHRWREKGITNAPKYPVCHLILHGNPIHAFVVYIDANGKIRPPSNPGRGK